MKLSLRTKLKAHPRSSLQILSENHSRIILERHTSYCSMITGFKKRANREFSRKIDEPRARFTTMAAEPQRAVKSKERGPIKEGDPNERVM